MRLVDWVAIVGWLVMLLLGVLLIVRPRSYGSRPSLARLLGVIIVLEGALFVADHLHVI